MHWVLASLLLFGCADDKQPTESVSDVGSEEVPDAVAPEDTAADQDTGVDEESTDCDVPDGLNWESWGRSFFRTWCGGCHAANAPNRHGAPESMVFDTEAQVVAHQDMIRLSVLEAGSMPLGGGLPQAEAEVLDLYLRCGLDR